jgi:hypothetical protein
MATTTNYGWATPDDTDLVKDGAAAIRTLGTSIDTSFAADEGDLLVGGTSDIFEALPIGAAGTVLTSDGDTAEWAAPAGGGKVLQVVQATYGTQTESTSTTWADTGLSVSITPTAATSKIMVLVNQPFELFRTSSGAGGGIRLLRGATFIWGDESANSPGSMYSSAGGSTSRQIINYVSFGYLDSPATTSATTYKTQFAVNDTSNSGRMRVQQGSNDSSIIVMEIGA